MRRSVQQSAVILLLTLAVVDVCADLIAPRSCCEWLTDIGGVLEHSPDLASNARQPEGFVTLEADNDRAKEHGDAPNNEEDCFCCCSHFLPSHNFDLAVVDPRPPDSLLTDARLPSAPPSSKFHPPRS